MISKEFYSDKGRQKQLFLGGFRKHFEHKDRTTVIGSYEYELQFGETIFDLTIKIFGKGNTRYWTILADMNKLIPVDDWAAGMVILLPEKVVFDSEVQRRKFV